MSTYTTQTLVGEYTNFINNELIGDDLIDLSNRIPYPYIDTPTTRYGGIGSASDSLLQVKTYRIERSSIVPVPASNYLYRGVPIVFRFFVFPDNPIPPEPQTFTIDGRTYTDRIIGEGTRTVTSKVWKFETFNYPERYRNPSYIDLLSGYPLDERVIPSLPTITLPADTKFTIGYYKVNRYEPVPILKSIDWRYYIIDSVANIPVVLPLVDCVLGTLRCNNADVTAAIIAANAQSGEYTFNYLFGDLPVLFTYWNSLNANLITLPPNTTSANIEVSRSSLLSVVGANNNHWNNRLSQTPDLNISIHLNNLITSSTEYNWHVKPQANGSYGNLVMDSPRTIETRLMVEQILKALNALEYQTETPAIVGTGTIDNPQTPASHTLDWYVKNSAGSKMTAIWKALGKDKYAENPLDNTQDRVANIGYLVEQIARILGFEPDPNGVIDVEIQKTKNQTKSADTRQPLDTDNYSPYGFGKKGIAIADLPNDHNGSNPISGGGSLVANLPNLMLALHAQQNKAFGIQDSSNIVFTVGDRKVHYTNQAALLIDLARTVAMMSQLLNTVYTNSLQTESEVREIIGALGLGTTDDSVGVNINGQSVNIPYKGVDRRESLVNELADIKLTLAVIAGKLI